MSQATIDELGAIHSGMADWCKLVLQGIPLLDGEGRAVLKPDGQPWLVPPSAAHLSVIRQFLKDNSVEALPAKGSPLGSLASKLPFAGSEELADKEQNYTAH
jgi:hypothetical protein